MVLQWYIPPTKTQHITLWVCVCVCLQFSTSKDRPIQELFRFHCCFSWHLFQTFFGRHAKIGVTLRRNVFYNPPRDTGAQRLRRGMLTTSGTPKTRKCFFLGGGADATTTFQNNNNNNIFDTMNYKRYIITYKVIFKGFYLAEGNVNIEDGIGSNFGIFK